jgi:RimJ/RimL family protein N-acetyltransferase
MSAPVLEADTLRLVPFGPAHLSARYLAWLGDRETMRFSEQRHRIHDQHSAGEFMARMERDGHFWAIEAKDAELGHVGNIAAYLDRPNSCADLSILVGEPAARGRGLGRRAWCLALDWLVSPAGGMRLVTAGTMAANVAMLGLMRTSGMREYGRLQGRFLLDGKPTDLVLAARQARLQSKDCG